MPTLAELASAARTAQDQYTVAVNDVKAARDTARAALRRYTDACTARIGDAQAPDPVNTELAAAMRQLEQVETRYSLANPLAG